MIECALPESPAIEDTILGSYTSHKVIPESPMIDGAADGGDEITRNGPSSTFWS